VNLTVLRAILSDLDPWLIGLGYGALAVLALWLLRATARSVTTWWRLPRRRGEGRGTGLFYAAAVAGMVVSLNTSWSYFGEVIGITDVVERGVMFFPLELAQLACGWGMRASIRRHGKPGPARFIAWFLCAISAYMAWGLSGFWVAVVRVLLGPVLSLVMLHLALGIEIRSLKVGADSVLARVSAELRERLLAYLGLSDEGRDAQAIARRLRVRRAVRVYMTGKGTPRQRSRFTKLLAKADLANDPEALEMFINSMKLAANVERIHDLRYPMPFEVPGDEEPTVKVLPTPSTRVKTTEPGGGRAQADVDRILRLIEKHGSETVNLEFVKLKTDMSHSTAARRLRAARQRIESSE
jgi:hypothetical protein